MPNAGAQPSVFDQFALSLNEGFASTEKAPEEHAAVISFMSHAA
jgi:hypothetical protein